MKKFALAAIAASVVAISSPASALTVIPVINSPFTAPGQVGGFFAITSTPDTYHFTFDLLTPLKTFAQLQVNGVENHAYALYTGGGTLVTSSVSPASFTSILSAGSYYLETIKTDASFDVISGAIATSAVPEPATWAMMILGFFGLGAALRRSRRQDDALTATA